MNVLRRNACNALFRPRACRPFTTVTARKQLQYRQTATAQNAAPQIDPQEEEQAEALEKERRRLTKGQRTFDIGLYNARGSEFYDTVKELEDARNEARKTLQELNLFPIPRLAKASLKPMRSAWKSKPSLSNALDLDLSASRYRKLRVILDQMFLYYRIALSADVPRLPAVLHDVLSTFEDSARRAAMSDRKIRPMRIDDFHRAYAFGRRKTSSARVWIAPFMEPEQDDVLDETLQASANTAQEETTDADAVKPTDEELDFAAFITENNLVLQEETSEAEKENEDEEESYKAYEYLKSGTITTSNILINNLPLVDYFPQQADRERVVRPLKLGGVLGKYNVFTLVRGGGTTGQAGAIAHGISKAILHHEPELENILRKSKLLKRDPRMVERKKPGLAKARKAYAWVKR